jgi:hypothetical protein
MHWLQRCEGSWRRAFLLFGAGIPTMFANLAVAAWIKFDSSLAASVLTTSIMAASLAFMAYFHRKWTTHILATEQLEQVGGWAVCLLGAACWGGGAVGAVRSAVGGGGHSCSAQHASPLHQLQGQLSQACRLADGVAWRQCSAAALL